MDVVGSWLRVGETSTAIAETMYGMAIWLFAYPLFFVWCVQAASLLRPKWRAGGLAGDLLISAVGAVAGAIPACSVWWASFLPEMAGISEVGGGFSMFCALALVVVFVWW